MARIPLAFGAACLLYALRLLWLELMLRADVILPCADMLRPAHWFAARTRPASSISKRWSTVIAASHMSMPLLLCLEAPVRVEEGTPSSKAQVESLQS